MFTNFYVAPSKRGNRVSTVILSRLSIITLKPIHKEQYTAPTAPPPPLIHTHQKTKQNKTNKTKTAENMAVELAIEEDDCRQYCTSPQMIPGPQMIPDRKRSPNWTANDPGRQVTPILDRK